jgi:hypothetical protein
VAWGCSHAKSVHATPPSTLRLYALAQASGGTWRSLAAHLTGGQGVAGSNPAVPTEHRRSEGVSEVVRGPSWGANRGASPDAGRIEVPPFAAHGQDRPYLTARQRWTSAHGDEAAVRPLLRAFLAEGVDEGFTVHERSHLDRAHQGASRIDRFLAGRPWGCPVGSASRHPRAFGLGLDALTMATRSAEILE